MIVLILQLTVDGLHVTKIMGSLEPGTNYFSKLMLKLEFGQMGGILSKYNYSRKIEIFKWKKKKKALKSRNLPSKKHSGL